MSLVSVIVAVVMSMSSGSPFWHWFGSHCWWGLAPSTTHYL